MAANGQFGPAAGLSQVENGLTVCRASCRPGQACYHFTGFTESADAEDVIALLREYHAAVGEKIIKYSGTLERYAGDGVMVVRRSRPCETRRFKQ